MSAVILSALATLKMQKLLALLGGFTMAKIIPKYQIDSKSCISFSSWLACVTMTLALGVHPELGHVPAILFMLIAGAVIGSAGLVSDFLPTENQDKAETEDEQYIKFLEADNEELTKLLIEGNQELLDEKESQRLELEAKDQEISYLKSLLVLDEKHISALTQICQNDELYFDAETSYLRTEIQECRDREGALESQNEELRTRLDHIQEEKGHLQRLLTDIQTEALKQDEEISRLHLEILNQDHYISELKEHYEYIASLDESHIAALTQAAKDDETYYKSQIQDLKNEIQEFRDREEQSHAQLKDSSDLIDSKQFTIEKLRDRTKDVASLKQERDAWQRECEILGREIEDLYEYTSGEDGVVGLYYRCKEAKTALKLADSEIQRLRSQRNGARKDLGRLEKKFLDLKGVFEIEFVAQSHELGEKCTEVEIWEERWNEQKELNAEAIEIVMEKAAEIEKLEEKVVSLREEVEEQQRIRCELELAVQGCEQLGSESESGSGSGCRSESEVEMVVKVQEERWSDDELYGICLGYDWQLMIVLPVNSVVRQECCIWKVLGGKC